MQRIPNMHLAFIWANIVAYE